MNTRAWVAAVVFFGIGVVALVHGFRVLRREPREDRPSPFPRWVIAAPFLYLGTGLPLIVMYAVLARHGVHWPAAILAPWAPIVRFIDSFE
ncbi:MAG: hypothetical protein KDC38_07460 [Planctomycetes bacterium]|nr:hypothetical protein [Planctomycetota bacterium]